MTPIKYLKNLVLRDLNNNKERLKSLERDAGYLTAIWGADKYKEHIIKSEKLIKHGEYLLNTVKFLENGWQIESLGSGGFIYSKPIKSTIKEKPLGTRSKNWMEKWEAFINGR